MKMTVTRGMLFIAFAAISLASCQKDAAITPNLTASSKTPAYTVGLPPVLVFWGKLQNSIPYVDHVDGSPVSFVPYAQGFAVNGFGFVCGGRVNGVFVPDLWEYSPATANWTKMAPFPAPGSSDVELAVNFVIGDNAYIIGNDKQTYRYNQPTNTWSIKAPFPGSLGDGPCGFSVNGLGYAGMGYAGNLLTFSSWYQYDPVGDRWYKMNDFPGNSRMAAASFSIDGKGYLIGGLHGTGTKEEYGSTVWQYTPGGIGANGSWVQKSNFPGGARFEANGASATIGGVDIGLLVGGQASSGTVDGDAWQYLPASDSWSQLPNILGGPRINPAVFTLGRSLFVANAYVDVFSWSR